MPQAFKSGKWNAIKYLARYRLSRVRVRVLFGVLWEAGAAGKVLI